MVMDLSDNFNRKEKDAVFVYTQKFHIRNLMNTPVDENPYQPLVGFNLADFFVPHFNASILKGKIASYLRLYNISPLQMMFTPSEKGILALNITTPTEDFSIQTQI